MQTYHISRIGPDGYVERTGSTMTDMWNRDASPEALAMTIQEAHDATGAPVLVTENGINTDRDAARVPHLRASVAQMAGQIAAGVPILGYIHWSLLDNFEWSSGYAPRFGMVAVDRATFGRAPKPSLAAYRALIAETRARHRWA